MSVASTSFAQNAAQKRTKNGTHQYSMKTFGIGGDQQRRLATDFPLGRGLCFSRCGEVASPSASFCSLVSFIKNFPSTFHFPWKLLPLLSLLSPSV
jgi:hypothetical protein